MTGVDLRAMEPADADLQRFRDIFERNGSPRSLEHLRWQYLENPTGQLLVDFAEASGEGRALAAIYAVMPVWMRIGGQRVLGVQSVDTMTDAGFRGRGLFISLARRVFSRSEKSGAACVYGFPNGSSAPGFFNKLGWSRLDPVPFLIKPLAASYFLRRLGLPRAPRIPLTRAARPRLPRSQEIHPVTSFGADIDALWDAFATGIGAAVQRDARYLTWRLQQKPGHAYRLLALSEHGKLVAFVAFDVREKHGGRIGYVMELLHQPGRQREAAALLQEAVSEMAQAGAEVVLAWCLPHSPNRTSFRREAFVSLPERLRPIQLHAGVRALAGPHAAVLGNRRNWYLSYLDSDTV